MSHTEPVDTCPQCDDDAPGRHLGETRLVYLWHVITEPKLSYAEATLGYILAGVVINIVEALT